MPKNGHNAEPVFADPKMGIFDLGNLDECCQPVIGSRPPGGGNDHISPLR